MTDNISVLRDTFVSRHLGPNDEQIKSMLKQVGASSLEGLAEQSMPSSIRNCSGLDLPKAKSESEFLEFSRSIANSNKVFKSYIGQGYYHNHTPGVVLRNILENPGWYTAYTPYQAEISQGRMEALLNFQTMVMDLTGMEIANASLLDEGTAAAEAMAMARNIQRRVKSNKMFVSQDLFSQSLEVVKTRAEHLGIELIVGDHNSFDFSDEVFAVLLQYPTNQGTVHDYSEFASKAKDNNSLVVVAADLLSLCLLKPPGEWGADIVVGTTQRFGVPMSFGGPHAAYIATKDKHKRLLPGRIIGVSKDRHGQAAMRLALQTREQHIRREKATSNICTAQVLLAVMASMYAVYHGPLGLLNIASRVHEYTKRFAKTLKAAGYNLAADNFFDTLTIKVDSAQAQKLIAKAEQSEINLGSLSAELISIAFDETTTLEDLENLSKVFTDSPGTIDQSCKDVTAIPETMVRSSGFLSHENFNSFHSETEMLRYIHRLEQKDLTLNSAMIPLGSCTMKLNATSEMIPVTWPEFANIHPFAPLNQAEGYLTMIEQLQNWLSEVTGFAGISLQPNAGSQGEYAGLLVIRKYLDANGGKDRNICLIPSSAHGTNPASADLAGMKVVVIGCDDQGNIDLKDLEEKATAHKDDLAALMITYPSTHGVFEEGLIKICDIVHDNGGQVYMDGANFNALVGVCQPGKLGPDVCHLNLHKTFAIPHGGGGPGIGPIGVAEHLKKYMPSHALVPECGPEEGITAVSSAPWGSAGVLPISWAYIAMMGGDGLRKATEVAILSANYIAKKMQGHYEVLYSGQNGLVAHECIIDVRPFKDSAGITVDDFAKRLMDYGFHAPTMSWPVAGTLMIEPTESESLEELDRFIDAMISIRQEVRDVEEGRADRDNNVLNQSPHCLNLLMANEWPHPYSREQACYPKPWVKNHKFWTPVGRVDNAFGDKNLVCSCPPMSAYEEQ